MNRIEIAQTLRDRTDRHFNCCQSVLIPFAQETGITEETAANLGAHFGSGMRVGSVCGALTGALMVLGMLGYGETEAKAFMEQFRQRSGHLNCSDLLEAAKERGQEKKPHCDGLITDVIRALEELMAEHSK